MLLGTLHANDALFTSVDICCLLSLNESCAFNIEFLVSYLVVEMDLSFKCPRPAAALLLTWSLYSWLREPFYYSPVSCGFGPLIPLSKSEGGSSALASCFIPGQGQT